MTFAQLHQIESPDFPCDSDDVEPVAVYAVALTFGLHVNDYDDNRFHVSLSGLAEKTRLPVEKVQAVMAHLERRRVLHRLATQNNGDVIHYRWTWR